MSYQSSVVKVGRVNIGGKHPVCVQSMTTTETLNTIATVKQIKELVIAGCDVVRVTTQNIKEAKNLRNIKDELTNQGINIPIIADVHYNPRVAEVAAKFTEKVRINPGNYISNSTIYPNTTSFDDITEHRTIEQNLIPLLNICEAYGTVIRIGVNHGSLSNRILYKYGNTPLGMVESIMEFVEICHRNEFKNLVLSVKASNVIIMIEANILLVTRLNEKNIHYPIHLGVTEAGSEEEGRIKSAVGIGYLLANGIGDTIRVSLAENPIKEIPVARKLIEYYGHKQKYAIQIPNKVFQFPEGLFKTKPPVIVTTGVSKLSDLSIEVSGKTFKQDNNLLLIYKFSYKGISNSELIIRAATDTSIAIINKNIGGIWIDNMGLTSADNLAELSLAILQVLGVRITKTEFIACPTCGRSSIDVINQLKKVKEQTSHLPKIKIAIMGCAVNGPGEMTDAHYGYVGSGRRKVNIYKGKSVIHKNIDEEIAVDLLIELIKESGDWIEKN